MNKGICTIDVCQSGLTPVGLLALEGNDKAVDFLLNEYKASPLMAIYGYSIRDEVHRLQNADSIYRGNPHYQK